MIRAIIQSTIEEYGLIHPGETVLVGLSGGPDSVALLHTLLSLSTSMGFRVAAGHLNHGIRDEAADADEQFVRELCELFGVPLWVEKADVPAIAKARGWTLEQAGREERYAFLHRAKEKAGAQRVAVAHHMDDQAESILLHLTRGTGLAGLVGMLPARGEIIRPLLFVRRGDVEEYIAQEGLAYCVDATNLETGSTRNRLRLDVIPYIEEHINPAFVDGLCSMAELLLRDETYLQAQADKLLEAARRPGGFDRETLKGEPLPILTRALRAALREAGAYVDIERVHIEQLIDLLSARTGAMLPLPGVQAYVQYDLVCFGNPAETPEFSLPFVLDGVTQTPLGDFVCTIVPRPAEFGHDRNVAFMDADKLDGLLARTRREGDRIYPIGAPGRKKLKEYFIDKKVPREKRTLPLLCMGEDVWFAPGFCSGEAGKVTEETTRVARIEYKQKEYRG
ncbi:MAG: tRNA lysidine(34) synthetase TilS [Clostridia bacterium]|nr:tRNA lysidine(34) synthetase TilS [Clostridia bacterium]